MEAILHCELKFVHLTKFILLWYFANDSPRVYSNLKVGGWYVTATFVKDLLIAAFVFIFYVAVRAYCSMLWVSLVLGLQ